MFATNAQRQARYRAKLKFSAGDAGFLTRLFGPEIPADCDDMYEPAKSVEINDHASPADVRAAIGVLVSNVIHAGIGGGFVGGWYRRERDGATTIAVCRLRSATKAAA